MNRDDADEGAWEFHDRFVSRGQRFSVGVERRSGRYYVSVPVANRRVDYEEYYEIDSRMYEQFLADTSEALSFVERCRRHEEDARLFYQPGTDRGTSQ
jgi:hypothetical protein